VAKGFLEKFLERAALNAAGVWGRKAANAMVEKAQAQVEKRSVAQNVKRATPKDEDDSVDEEDTLDMID